MTTIKNTTHSEHVSVSDLVKHPRDGQTDLYLVRHGRTEANVNRLLVGSTDIPLDPLGEEQARRVAKRFRTINIHDILSSPLSRARRTAEAIGAITGHTPILVPGLSEIDFGMTEGLTMQQVLQQFPEIHDEIEDIENLDLTFPGGESRRGFATRIMTAFLGIIERYENKAVAAVCHGGVIGAICAQVGVGPTDNALRWAVANTSVTHLVVTPEHTRIELWNDISHLEDLHQWA